MKKFFIIAVTVMIVFGLVSCKKNQQNQGEGSDVSETAAPETTAGSQTSAVSEKSTTQKTAKDYSDVLRTLSAEKMDFVASLGKTEKDKKIVAFFGSDLETEFLVFEFNNGKVSSAKRYVFYKDDKVFGSYEKIAELDESFTVHKKEKCIENSVISKYRNKTYSEVYDALKGYYNFR